MTQKREQTPRHRSKSRIPEFASREEEAAFWDTHDTTDFEDEFKPVKVHVAKDLIHILQIPFDSKEMRALSACAQETGTDIITLAKQWVLDRLREAEQ